MLAKAWSTSCERDGATPCSMFCFCTQLNSACSTIYFTPQTLSAQVHNLCGSNFQRHNIIQGSPNICPLQSGRPGPAVAKQKGDMKVNPSTSHDPQQSPPSSLSSSHCAQRQRGRSGCLGGISVLAQAWCVHGLTSNVTASSGVIVADAARQQAPGVHPSHL